MEPVSGGSLSGEGRRRGVLEPEEMAAEARLDDPEQTHLTRLLAARAALAAGRVDRAAGFARMALEDLHGPARESVRGMLLEDVAHALLAEAGASSGDREGAAAHRREAAERFHSDPFGQRG